MFENYFIILIFYLKLFMNVLRRIRAQYYELHFLSQIGLISLKRTISNCGSLINLLGYYRCKAVWGFSLDFGLVVNNFFLRILQVRAPLRDGCD